MGKKLIVFLSNHPIIMILLLISIGSGTLFSFCYWTEHVSRTTQLELDAILFLGKDTGVVAKNKDGYYIKTLYTYEDDKITIKADSNNRRFLPYWDDDVTSPYNRNARFIQDGMVLDIWINTNPKTLVYHSKNTHYGQWRTPRDQDKYRKDLTYRKGKWVKYLKNLANAKKKELYKEYKIQYKKRKKELKKERVENKEFYKTVKLKEKKEWKEYKKEKKRLAKLAKDRLKKATVPIDDKELFRK